MISVTGPIMSSTTVISCSTKASSLLFIIQYVQKIVAPGAICGTSGPLASSAFCPFVHARITRGMGGAFGSCFPGPKKPLASVVTWARSTWLGSQSATGVAVIAGLDAEGSNGNSAWWGTHKRCPGRIRRGSSIGANRASLRARAFVASTMI